MEFLGEAAILAATMNGRMSLRRQISGPDGLAWQSVFENRPCALSRSAHTASPAPAGPNAPMAESRYRMTLFMPAGTVTRLGDRAEIDQNGQVFVARLSDSLGYLSHSVCVADIQEVRHHD